MEHLKTIDFDPILGEGGDEVSESGLYAQGVAGVEVESVRLAPGQVQVHNPEPKSYNQGL